MEMFKIRQSNGMHHKRHVWSRELTLAFSLGVLAPNLTPQGQASLLGKLTSFTTTNSIDNTMRTTGMRTILSSFEIAESQGQLPASTQTAYGPVSKTLIPYLIDNAMKQAPAAFDNNVIDIIVDLVRVFGPRISEMEKNSIQKSLLQIIHNESMATATRKKAINALSTLATQLPDRLLGPLVSKSIEAVRRTDCPPSRRRLLITLFGSLVRSVPHRVAPQAKSIIPLILNMLSEEAYQGSLEQLAETGSYDEEVEELFEAALAAMEGFIVSSCKEISPFVDSTIDAALRFLRYDPNVADDGDDDTEMVDTQNDDNHEDDANGFDAEDEQDYEEEGNQSDDDDSSWKVRRCAIKILQAIIRTRGSIDLVESGVLYQNVAPTLIKRFSEREEIVRIEIIGTLAQLVRQSKTSQYHGQNGTAMVERRPTLPTRSRKRRRDSNGLDISTSQGPGPIEPGINSPALSPSPSSGPQAELVHLIPKITQAAQKTLKQDQPASKLAATSLLKDLVLIQPGALTDTLSELIESLAESLQASGAPTHMSSLSTNANAGGSLRMETLRLLAVVCDNHSSKIIATNIESVVLSVASAAKDRMTRVAVEAIRTLESITRAFTPPRSAGIEQSHPQSINNIFDTIIDLARKADADLEVRQQAIIALGVVVARASSQGNAKMLGPGKESSAFAVIAERLRNETTRLAAIQAIDALAGSLNKFEEIQNTWVEDILIELLGQLRKADRLLRDSSLLALKSIALNKELFDRLNESTANFLTQALLPLINADDLNSLGTALTIYARIAIFDALVIANDSVVQQISALIRRSLSLPTLDALAALLKAIGEKGSGQAFMNSFLQQGIRGDITVSGRAIATLLVYGDRSIEVTVDDFAKELGNADESRVCLALSILGEAGLLFGSSPPATLQPKLFMKYLKSRSDQVTRAAAVALGRAGVGNKSSYLPAILQLAKGTNDMKYLALHAIRELLTSANRYEVELSALADSIWDALMAASSPEDNQVLGAECLGRLALVDPTTYLPKLQVSACLCYNGDQRR